MIFRVQQLFRRISPTLNSFNSAVSVFAPPVLVSSAIALGCYFFVITRWTPLLRSGALLLLLIGIIGVLRLFQVASYDRLTGLPNRAFFLKRLERILRQKRYRQGDRFGVFWIDLDQFKLINDKFGKDAGDFVLIAVARRLRRCLPPSSLLARVGGNEFAIVRRNLTEASATQLAERFQAKLAVPFHIHGQPIYITASTGIVLSTDYIWADDLRKDAQIAMYHVKNQGRGRYALFHPDMRVQPLSSAELESELRLALERQELELYYQPLVSLTTGRIAGFEALLRWHHTQRGVVYPSEFIPIAEDSGLIIAIGHWVLHQACSQMKLWQRQFPNMSSLLMSVNLSSKQFSQPNLLQQIQQVLQITGLEGRYLKLEITESLLMDDMEMAIATLQDIKTLNVRLGLDDFGTGYSSLSHLYHFPTDTLKVDQSFIKRLGTDSDNDEIVRTIITLAHKLGMTVIAEGIETPRQLAFLRSNRCEYGQGYLFAEPLDSSDIEALLSSNPHW
ncbi:MAG TPA: bifunctional diguanylate cyclase/phosphodiesterase [Crinalium sp.]